jgi:hypothetical protein
VFFIAVQIGLDDARIFNFDFIKRPSLSRRRCVLGYVVIYFVLHNQKAKTLSLKT